MSISFSLSLTPNQIEFLQRLDLYASGVIQCILDVDKDAGPGRSPFVTHVQKLVREGLVVHVPAQGMEMTKHRFYQITPKGQSVLAMIDDDVRQFISRQNEIKRLRKQRKPKAS